MADDKRDKMKVKKPPDPPTPKVLGNGLAKEAGEALKNRRKRLREMEKRAVSGKKRR